MDDLELMGTKEVAAYLNIKPPSLYDILERHHIPHKTLACGSIFLKSDIEAFQKQRTKRKNQKNSVDLLP